MFGNPESKPLHQRSQSSPYFQHTRGFTGFKDLESGLESHLTTSPTGYEASVSAPCPRDPHKAHGHARALTPTSPTRRLPLVTTHIQVESKPAILPAAISNSLFSSSANINFDLSPPISPSLSPKTEKERWSAFTPNLKPKSKEEKTERSPSPIRIANWFQGESAPVNISVLPSPIKELADPVEASQNSRPTVAKRISVATSIKPQKPAGTGSGIFSFFTNKSSPMSTPIPQDVLNDEFVALDIKEALQPHGPADPFSPSSFKNLQQNAEGLLAKMQAAYKQQVLALKEFHAEQEVQDEELEEAQTRAHHLKTQLNDISGRLDEREKEMLALREELEEERRLRKEAERSTIRVVGENTSPSRGRGRGRTSLGSTFSSTPSMMSDTSSDPGDSSETLHENTPDSPSPHGAIPRSHPYIETASEQYALPRSPCKRCENRHIASIPTVDGSLGGGNADLKARVWHLEKELDGCLDLLRDIGLSS